MHGRMQSTPHHHCPQIKAQLLMAENGKQTFECGNVLECSPSAEHWLRVLHVVLCRLCASVFIVTGGDSYILMDIHVVLRSTLCGTIT